MFGLLLRSAKRSLSHSKHGNHYARAVFVIFVIIFSSRLRGWLFRFWTGYNNVTNVFFYIYFESS